MIAVSLSWIGHSVVFFLMFFALLLGVGTAFVFLLGDYRLWALAGLAVGALLASWLITQLISNPTAISAASWWAGR